MKKLALKSLLLMAAFVVALNATAQTPTIQFSIPDFAIKAGETKTFGIYLQNNVNVKETSFQLFLSQGLTIVPFIDEDENEELIQAEGYSTKKNYSFTGVVFNLEGGVQNVRFVGMIMSTVNPFKVVDTPTCFGKIQVKAAEDFAGGTIEIKTTESFSCMASWVADDVNASAGNAASADWTTTVYPVKPLAWILENGANGGKYGVEDAAAVVGTAGNMAILQNADKAWMKVIASAEAISGFTGTVAGESVMGTYSVVNGNPQIETTVAPTQAVGTITPAITHYMLKDHFAPEANEVCTFKGYYRASDKAFCAYGNFGGDQGQCITTDLSFNQSGTTPTDQQYCTVTAVMQQKKTWEEAALTTGWTDKAGNGAWKNYVAYAINVTANDPTAVNDIATSNVVNVKYVNVAGQESATPFNGVNIVVTTYEDGTTTASKVIR